MAEYATGVFAFLAAQPVFWVAVFVGLVVGAVSLLGVFE